MIFRLTTHLTHTTCIVIYTTLALLMTMDIPASDLVLKLTPTLATLTGTHLSMANTHRTMEWASSHPTQWQRLMRSRWANTLTHIHHMNLELRTADREQQATLHSQVILLVAPCAMKWAPLIHET